MSLQKEVRPIIRSVILFTMLVLACRSDSTTGPGTNPQVLSSPNLAALVCTANPSARTLSCASPVDPGNRGISLSYAIDPSSQNPGYAIFGGNHTNVEVTTTNIANDIQNHLFSFDLSLKNLSVQPIGTTNGISSDGSLSIFFQSGPTATGGTGIVTVSNPDGFGTFTAAGQPFFSYGEMLAQNQTSNSKNWVLDYAPTVTSFSFILLINASLQFPDGYIDVYPKTGVVVIPGGTFQLADTVRNGLGAVNSLQKVAWTSSDPTTVTVDSLGLVKGIKLGSATITATQSLKIGSIVVQVLPPTPPNALSDSSTSISVPGDPFHAFFNTEFTRNAPGVLANDNRGAPLAVVTSFGGDSIRGAVTDHAAGTEVSPLPGHADGSLQINIDGRVIFTPPTDFTGYYETEYRISNGVGTSDAAVKLAVGVRPDLFDIEYTPHLLENVGINTSVSSHRRVGASGDALKFTVTVDSLGAASIHGDGTFEFRPDFGKVGIASFDFTAANGFGTAGPAKVTLQIVGPRLMFVDSAAAAGGDGSYDHPFNCLVGLPCYALASAQGDIVHVRHGKYFNTTTWNLQVNARVIGEGAPGLFSDASNANVEWPADAGPQPPTGGARPVINSGNQSGLGPADNTVTRGVVLGSAPVFALNSAGGNFTLTDAAIVNPTGGAVQLSNFGAANISVDSIISGSSPGGAAMSINNRTGTLNSAVTKIIGTEGINISKGSISINLGTGVLQSTNAAAVNFSQSQANFSFAGAVSNSFMPLLMNGINVLCGTVTFSGTVSSTQRGIDVRNCTGGSVSFTGPVTLSTAANRAISVLNSAAPVTFSGGALSATSTTANALFARKADVSVSGANNTLSSAGAPALLLDTVSTSGLTFRSISANGGTSGIFLRNMSGTGGLSVTGDAGGICGGNANLGGSFVPPNIADCTGGTIQGMTGTSPDGVGIYLENAKNISLGRMRIRGNANFGILGDSVAGFALGRDYLSNNGLSATGEGTGNVYLYGLIGTASMDNSFADSGYFANVFVKDTVGALSLTMNGMVIGNDGATTGRRGVFIGAVNSNVTASIQNSRFLGSREIGAHMLVNGLSTANFTFSGNVMTNNHPSVLTGHHAVAVETVGTAGALKPDVTYTISNNIINNNTGANQSGDVITILKGAADNGFMRGSISNNNIGNGVSKSGSALGSGIAVSMVQNGGDSVNISGNNIKNVIISGIAVANQAPTLTGRLAAVVTGNNINTPEATSLNPIAFFLGQTGSTGKNCLTIGGLGPLANTISYGTILLSVRTTTPVGLPGFITDPAAYLASRNNGAASTVSLFSGASLSGTCP